MYFFTSDTHFGCDEILLRENRPFKNMEDFKDSVFQFWNSQAKATDTIYHLGDFVNYNKTNKLGWQKALEEVKQINAKVILIIGNNEQRIIEEFFDKNFEKFRQYCKGIGFFDVKQDDYIEFNNEKFYLNHFPRNHKENYINLFGHTHRTTGLWKPYGLNVGCDLNHFYLFSENEIERLLSLKTRYWDDDIDNLCLS